MSCCTCNCNRCCGDVIAPVEVNYTAPSAPLLTIGVPAGTAFIQTVTVTVSAPVGYYFLKAWLQDVTTPTQLVTLVPPAVSGLAMFEVVTASNGTFVFSFDNTGQAARTWFLCVELGGVCKLSQAITLGS